MLFRGSLKKTEYNKKNNISLPGKTKSSRKFAPRSSGGDFPGRAAFCTSSAWKQGSMTVEAAFALPLFFLTVLSLISLLGIYGSYASEMVSLQQKAEKLALMQIYVSDESNLPIRLSSTVQEKMLLLPFDGGRVKARVSSCVLPWTGRSDYSSLEGSNSSEGKLYYLSDHRSVYHTSSGCSYLSLQIAAVNAGKVSSRRNENGDHYSACQKCIGSGETGAVVYITENGDHYHNSAECSGLKRSVHLVEESEIAELSWCSRCRKMEGS